jgi:tetratricopeptide (TPR) repeat protein
MKYIPTAVTLIALTSVLELNRVESALGYYMPNAQIEQLKTIPILASPNLLEEGAKKQDQEDYRGAIADYTEFLNTYPVGKAFPVEHRVEAYSNRGFSKAMLDDLAGAIQDFDRAIELAPNSADAYNARGNVNAMAGNPAQSIRDFNRAIRCNRNFADAYYNRAIGRHDLGDHLGAKVDFHQAAKLFQQQKDLGGYQQAREWIIKLR